MTPSLSVLTVLLAAPAPAEELPTKLWRVAPDAGAAAWSAAAAAGTKARAVVLVPGLHVHPLRPDRVAVPDLRTWEEPKSELVKALARDSDVFAFGYAQTVAVDEVALAPGLRAAVERLRNAGYADVVLVGHSAGGVIARQFVERYPDAGVTKVIAVAAPFAGAEAATLKIGYPKVQKPFVRSLAPDARAEAVRSNPSPLGADVEFACVVCKLKHAETDGLVFVRSQWPDDLQKSGVPAVLASVSHVEAMHSAAVAKTVAELVREKVAHWSPEDVARARKLLFAEPREK
jgi:hypothetical protein